VWGKRRVKEIHNSTSLDGGLKIPDFQACYYGAYGNTVMEKTKAECRAGIAVTEYCEREAENNE